MRIFIAACAAAFVVVVAIEAEAQLVPCQKIVNGIKVLDTDCDGVDDTDSYTDSNLDGIADGIALDNCKDEKNGSCSEDRSYFDGCDSNKDAYLSPAELVLCDGYKNCDISGDGIVSWQEVMGSQQSDWNNDRKGDACQDSEGDGLKDWEDACKMTSRATCNDSDSDGVEDAFDNCQTTYNPRQQNYDGDNYGDACDSCMMVANNDQDPSVCKGSYTPIDPVVVVPPDPPVPTEPSISDHVQGGGSCSLDSSGAAAPFALLAFLPALALLLWKRERQ